MAGVLAACAILLRPESLWYAAGLALVSCSVYRTMHFGAGMATVLLPFALLNTVYIGAPAGPHATWNLALLREAWLPARAHRADLWLVPHDRLALLGMSLIVAAWLLARRSMLRHAQALGCAK